MWKFTTFLFITCNGNFFGPKVSLGNEKIVSFLLIWGCQPHHTPFNDFYFSHACRNLDHTILKHQKWNYWKHSSKYCMTLQWNSRRNSKMWNKNHTVSSCSWALQMQVIHQRYVAYSHWLDNNNCTISSWMSLCKIGGFVFGQGTLQGIAATE